MVNLPARPLPRRRPARPRLRCDAMARRSRKPPPRSACSSAATVRCDATARPPPPRSASPPRSPATPPTPRRHLLLQIRRSPSLSHGRRRFGVRSHGSARLRCILATDASRSPPLLRRSARPEPFFAASVALTRGPTRLYQTLTTLRARIGSSSQARPKASAAVDVAQKPAGSASRPPALLNEVLLSTLCFY